MIIGNENILTWFKAQNRPNWKLKKSANSDVIAFSQKQDPTIDEAIEELQATFNYIAPGQYLIECWEGSDKRGRAKSPVQIDGNPDKNYKSGGIAGIYGPEELEQKINEGIERYRRDQEFEETKKRLEELEKERESLQYKLLQRLEPYIPVLGQIITSSLTGGKAPNIGNTGTKKKMSDEPLNNEPMNKQKELIERANEALEKWFDIDPDAVELMEKIAALAQNDKDTYQMAKNMLMSK